METNKKPKEFKFRAIADIDLVVNCYRIKSNYCPFISFIKIGLALN
jgi:hypothetical protein